MMDETLATYRQMLVDTLRFLNEAYDKILVTLAGGALGLSLAFLKDVISLENIIDKQFLIFAWLGFILSLACVLGRILFGIEAYRRAIRQVDDGTIYDAPAGGAFSKITRSLHIASAVFLVLGLLFIAMFTYANMGGSNVPTKTQSETTANSTTNTREASEATGAKTKY